MSFSLIITTLRGTRTTLFKKLVERNCRGFFRIRSGAFTSRRKPLSNYNPIINN